MIGAGGYYRHDDYPVGSAFVCLACTLRVRCSLHTLSSANTKHAINLYIIIYIDILLTEPCARLRGVIRRRAIGLACMDTKYTRIQTRVVLAMLCFSKKPNVMQNTVTTHFPPISQLCVMALRDVAPRPRSTLSFTLFATLQQQPKQLEAIALTCYPLAQKWRGDLHRAQIHRVKKTRWQRRRWDRDATVTPAQRLCVSMIGRQTHRYMIHVPQENKVDVLASPRVCSSRLVRVLYKGASFCLFLGQPQIILNYALARAHFVLKWSVCAQQTWFYAHSEAVARARVRNRRILLRTRRRSMHVTKGRDEACVTNARQYRGKQYFSRTCRQWRQWHAETEHPKWRRWWWWQCVWRFGGSAHARGHALCRFRATMTLSNFFRGSFLRIL